VTANAQALIPTPDPAGESPARDSARNPSRSLCDRIRPYSARLGLGTFVATTRIIRIPTVTRSASESVRGERMRDNLALTGASG